MENILTVIEKENKMSHSNVFGIKSKGVQNFVVTSTVIFYKKTK